MKKSFKIILISNSIGALFSAAWAYSSHMQNMINVGGLKGDYDFWYNLEPFIIYPALTLWIVLLIASPFLVFRDPFLKLPVRIGLVAASIFAMPFVLFGLSALFTSGMPPSPV